MLLLALVVPLLSAFFYAPPAAKLLLPRKAAGATASSASSASASSSSSSSPTASSPTGRVMHRPRTPIFWMAPLMARLWKKTAPTVSRSAGAPKKTEDCACGGTGCGCGGGGEGAITFGSTRRSLALASAASSSSGTGQEATAKPKAVHVVAVVPGQGARGKLEAPWTEVMAHMHRRMQYFDPTFHLHVVTQEELLAKGVAAFQALPLPGGAHPDLLYFLGVTDPGVAPLVQRYVARVPHVLSLDSCPALTRKTRIGPAHPYGPFAAFWKAFPLPTERKRLLTLFETVQGFWSRGHSDDVLYMVLVVINAVLTDIPAVSEILKPVTFRALQCMLSNCGKQIIDCQRNPTCKAALSCLERCAPNDQVCRYRCIVQYETKEFEQFALCILQKHNCLQNHAAIPVHPDPAPITHFRGEPLTHEMAEEISFGHLGSLGQQLPWSWKVICGQNPAYDFFPAQHMTYYLKGKSAMWYQPVFRVILLDGTQVWRRRLYRVRRGKTPGTFFYSVLDNGVVSSEFWRVIEVADDLSWILFYYSGAAAAAGQSYQGAILASPDGEWPPHPETYKPRILAALDRAGIKEWELFKVRHEGGSDGAPLEIDPLADSRFIFGTGQGQAERRGASAAAVGMA